MITLFTLPGSCSMGPHILLHELEIPHEVEVVDLKDGRARFERLNPRCKVPALSVEGEILTEQLGIDTYLAGLRPDRELVPQAPMERGRVYEALGFANSGVHPAVGHIYFPHRYVGEDEVARERFVAGAQRRFAASLELLDPLIAGPYLLGERFSLADPYLFVMYRWATGGGVDMTRLPGLSALGQAMSARPAVQKVLAIEGLS